MQIYKFEKLVMRGSVYEYKAVDDRHVGHCGGATAWTKPILDITALVGLAAV